MTPDLLTIWSLFSHDVPEHTPVKSADVPEPYRRLLVHEHHMTVTLERHCSSPVKLHVLAEKHVNDTYVRKLTLTSERTGETVMFGIVRLDLACVSDAVRAEILARQTPLGRILIHHNVLRRVEFHRVLRFTASTELAAHVTLPTYGRLATIFCDGRPAIELLEVVAGGQS